MSFESFVGLRFLQGRSGSRFLSMVTFISSAGITLGVAVLIVVLSVIDGYEDIMRDKILGANAHIILFNSAEGGTISSYEELSRNLEKEKGVVRADPFSYLEVMLTSGDKKEGIVIKGVLPEYLDVVRGFSKLDVSDDFFLEGGKKIILGTELASSLGVSEGDTVRCLVPRTSGAGRAVVPEIFTFRVAGIFDSGMYEWDRSLAYTSLATVSAITGLRESVSAVEMRIENPEDVDEVEEGIREKYAYPYYTQTWKRMNSNLFSALRTQKIMLFIIVMLIILVASFNIMSTLLISVLDRRREIAVLKSMGASKKSIIKLFMLKGLVIGATGIVAGNAIAFALCYILKNYPFIDIDFTIYYMKTLPVSMSPLTFLMVTVYAVAVSLFFSVFPAWQASRQNPVELLRYE